VDLFKVIYELTKQIPKGTFSSYGAIARALGDVRACRAVGVVLNANTRLGVVPCHRVVSSDGCVGGFSRGVSEKIRMLRGEGVVVSQGRVADFERLFFDDFVSDYPLNKLAREQVVLAEKVGVEDMFDEIKLFGGVDVSYSIKDPRSAVGAVVVLGGEGDVVESRVLSLKVSFPYIPTYFSFREYPVIEKLFNCLKTKPDILLVDGNGILHPRGAGLASHCGVRLGVPSIGVAKKLLAGKVSVKPSSPKKPVDVMVNERRCGVAVIPTKHCRNPIYVSPGHMISVDTAYNRVFA